MALRNQRRETRSADAELAVGALERPDLMDLEDVDLSPTMLGLDEAEESGIPSTDLGSEGCIICGQ